MKRLARASVVALCPVAAGCSSPMEPAEERFDLATIRGAALPGPYPDPWGCCTALEVTAGRLVLGAEGDARLELQARCRADLDPSTTCEVAGDGWSSADGTYSRAEGWVRLGDATFPATFEAERVVVDVGAPVSGGVLPRFLLEFRRH